MLGQRHRQGYNIQSSERDVNVFTGPSEYDSIWQTDIIYIKVQKLSIDYDPWNLICCPNPKDIV